MSEERNDSEIFRSNKCLISDARRMFVRSFAGWMGRLSLSIENGIDGFLTDDHRGAFLTRGVHDMNLDRRTSTSNLVTLFDPVIDGIC